MTTSDLTQEVIRWFGETGYPLEMHTARAMRQGGFSVESSAVFSDPETSKSREIDVLAWKRDATAAYACLFPIECKASKKPWVVLTSPNQEYSFGGLWIGTYSKAARSAFGPKVLDFVRIYGEVFGGFTGGFGLKQAFGGEHDPAYSACISLLKACRSLCDSKDESQIEFSFPTIVVDTPIFELDLAIDGTVSVREVPQSHFNFSAHLDEYTKLVIHVVSKSALQEHSAKCSQLFDAYRALFTEEISALFKSGT